MSDEAIKRVVEWLKTPDGMALANKVYSETDQSLAAYRAIQIPISPKMMQETLDDVSKAVGYSPNHYSEFSGDILVELIKRIAGEREAMLNRLIEIQEVRVRDNGESYWISSGDPIYEKK